MERNIISSLPELINVSVLEIVWCEIENQLEMPRTILLQMQGMTEIILKTRSYFLIFVKEVEIQNSSFDIE